MTGKQENMTDLILNLEKYSLLIDLDFVRTQQRGRILECSPLEENLLANKVGRKSDKKYKNFQQTF